MGNKKSKWKEEIGLNDISYPSNFVVYGYLRNCEKMNHLEIAEEIKDLCFKYFYDSNAWTKKQSKLLLKQIKKLTFAQLDTDANNLGEKIEFTAYFKQNSLANERIEILWNDATDFGEEMTALEFFKWKTTMNHKRLEQLFK
eukprot:492902_1